MSKKFDKKAEEILNNLNQEEDNKDYKKDDKKDNKKGNKKDNKKGNKKDNKKGNKKDNTTWIKNDDNKFSNKVIKITSPIWFMQMNIMGEHHNYQLAHKVTKKGNIKIRLQNDNFDFAIKCNKMNENDFDFSINKVINKNGKETIEKYDKDFIEEYGNVIPFKILLSPIVDFYFNMHTSLLTDGNCKERNNSLIVDANIRKEGYKIEPKDLSIEELDDLNRDYDNRLACSLEYFRRYTLLNVIPDDEGVETEKAKAVETEKAKAVETEKAKAVETEKAKAVETGLIIPVTKNKSVTAIKEINEVNISNKVNKANKVETNNGKRRIVEKTKVQPKEKTAEEKIIQHIMSHDSDIENALKDCTNVAERGRCFIQHLIQKLVPTVTVGDIIAYLSLNKAWEFYVFESRNVIEIRRTQMLEFMISQISVAV